jgi:hypothetical protein
MRRTEIQVKNGGREKEDGFSAKQKKWMMIFF